MVQKNIDYLVVLKHREIQIGTCVRQKNVYKDKSKTYLKRLKGTILCVVYGINKIILTNVTNET